jgi:hypothetical protein
MWTDDDDASASSPPQQHLDAADCAVELNPREWRVVIADAERSGYASDDDAALACGVDAANPGDFHNWDERALWGRPRALPRNRLMVKLRVRTEPARGRPPIDVWFVAGHPEHDDHSTLSYFAPLYEPSRSRGCCYFRWVKPLPRFRPASIDAEELHAYLSSSSAP